MSSKYIGIENELKSFQNSKVVSASDYFSEFINKSDFTISNTAIRTSTGHGFYVDGCELEIVTPPVAINCGFASRLTDLLMIGRERVITGTPGYTHTGYSMHWNLSAPTLSRRDFYEGIMVPFTLFGLTPLSCGMNVREKGRPNENENLCDKSRRFEILGDSIKNENQINALALLLGAYTYAIEHDSRTPLQIRNTDSFFYQGQRNINQLAFNGRYSSIKIDTPSTTVSDEISAQQYLELFYKWISPYVKKLGTKSEIKNLESFIYGDQKLEFDNFKYWEYIRRVNGNQKGTYMKIQTSDPNLKGQVLESDDKKRDLPLEGRVLGEILKRDNIKVKTMQWDLVTLTEGECEPEKTYNEIENIYSSLLKLLDPKIPIAKLRSRNLQNIKPGKIDKIEKKKYPKYDFEKDNFSDKSNMMGYLKEIGRTHKKKLLALAAVSAIVGYVTLSYSQHLENNQRINKKIQNIIANYDQNIQTGIMMSKK